MVLAGHAPSGALRHDGPLPLHPRGHPASRVPGAGTLRVRHHRLPLPGGRVRGVGNPSSMYDVNYCLVSDNIDKIAT